MSYLHISLPKPCGERWDGMAEQGCNRHCAVCSQTIHEISRLTVAQVEHLLDSTESACVRAQIRPNGNVLAANDGRIGRQIKAMVGASLGLAVAACQTASVTPLYVISGQADAGVRVTVSGDNGLRKSARTDRHGRFKIANLSSGNYVLTTYASCGGEELTVPGIQVGKSNVDIGTVEGGDGGCIIVGLMERAVPPNG